MKKNVDNVDNNDMDGDELFKKTVIKCQKNKKMKREPAFQKVKCVILPGIHLI